MTKNLTKQQKKMAFLLRHEKKEKSGVDDEGWLDVVKLQTECDLNEEDLRNIVENNNKKRFEFNKDGSKIRARQGHSIEVDVGMSLQKPPEFLYHGTSSRFYKMIMAEGLKSMSRLHVHLSADVKTAENVGKRHGGELIIFKVAAGRAWEKEQEFWKSNNGVWLTKNLDVEFLEELNTNDRKEND